MKIALVHDYLKEYGGAESVLETLSDIFPDADIYTALYHPASFGPHRSRLEKKWKNHIHQSFFKYLPFSYKIISPLRLLSPLAFRFFDFSGYDLIITSATGAYFPNALNKKSARLVCYCHTPPRYLYGFATGRDLSRHRFIWFLAQFANHFLRLLDFKYAQNVNQFIANSQTTAARIRKFYRRDSVVINPPVDIPKIKNLKIKKNNYYLTGGRIAWAKHFDIAIAACNTLKLPLKIFGRDFSGVAAQLKTIAGPTIEFLGEIENDKRNRLLTQAQAFIFCSDNEDFGIAPVEAMAVGTPVIAYRRGGTTETIVDGQTGVFFDELTPASCAAAIQKLDRLKIDPEVCIRQAQQFSKEIFVARIKKLVSNL